MLWHIDNDHGKGEPKDLTLNSQYSQRVQYLGNKEHNCTFRINNLTERDSATYCFRFLTNTYSGKFSGIPGVTLTVRALQVSVNPDTVSEGERVTLTCNTTCTVNYSLAFIWYKNGNPLPNINQNLQFSASSEDAGSYSCAVKDGPKSASVSVRPSGEIVEGSSVTLTCSSNANPPVYSYTWYKNRYRLLRTGSEPAYTFEDVTYLDAGEYYCEAKNDIGTVKSPHLYLKVQYAPKTTLVTVNPSAEIVEGSSVTLTCSSNANPPVQSYTWFVQNQHEALQTGKEQTYTIAGVSKTHAGEYYCEAQNDVGKGQSPHLHLNVQYSPKNTSVSVSPSGEIEGGSSVTLTCSSNANPPVQRYTWLKKSLNLKIDPGTVREGDNVKLTCSTTCSLHSPTFIWYKNRNPLSNTNQILQFSASSDDAGSYSCAVSGYESLPSTAVTLIVRYAPMNTLLTVSPSAEIVEGISVTLTCSSNANPPVQSYGWFKKNQYEALRTGKEQTYTIARVSKTHAGEYYCEAQNDVGKGQSPHLHLNVQYAPQSTSVLVSPSGEIVEGSSVTLTCSSNANPPVHNYTWFQKNETGVWQTGSGQSLNFSNIRSWNSGQYYCEAKNKIRAHNSTAQLITVQGIS
ncbi:B-cell receptor CD22-like [Megalops cyprinoides]|uniref:B-cell receptor CD22-like n=1 Tax=Megalops cyprinoides TaxID=118141 RepID=UPI001864AA29|nr:B-cell receptor CD22-like [Megalops cyprinoides]